MKDYIPLKVEFCLYENILCGKIIQQDDRLINKIDKDGMLKENINLYHLYIYNRPALHDDALFLRGKDKDANNNTFYYSYVNRQSAEYALKNFKELITQVNNFYADRGGIIEKTNTCLIEVCE